jgi:hypothetical protein
MVMVEQVVTALHQIFQELEPRTLAAALVYHRVLPPLEALEVVARLVFLVLQIQVAAVVLVAQAVLVLSSFVTPTHLGLQLLQLVHQQLRQRVVLEFIGGRVQARSHSDHGIRRHKACRA